MSELVTQDRKPSIAAGGSIASIVPQNLDEAFRLSTAIHQAGMSPYGIDTPQKVMIAMLAGLELGMPPMQAVQSIAVINNRPCMWGDGLIGVVRRNPACLYVKEWMEGTGDDRIAHCETKRRGEDEPVSRSFSVEDAKRAGLWQTEARVTKQGKSGPYTKDNDSPWYKYPQRMLQMRARAWCLRDVYPDVLKGMHSREEVEDYAHGEPVAEQVVLPPLEERLRIARQTGTDGPQEAEGFDREFVTRETSDAPAKAASEEEPSSAPSTDDVGSGAAPQAPHPGDAADLGAGDLEEREEPSSSPAPVLTDADRAFLVRVFKTMREAVGPDVDVLKRQALVFKDDIAGMSDLVKAKAKTIREKLEKCCGEEPEMGTIQAAKYLAGVIGVDERDLV